MNCGTDPGREQRMLALSNALHRELTILRGETFSQMAFRNTSVMRELHAVCGELCREFQKIAVDATSSYQYISALASLHSHSCLFMLAVIFSVSGELRVFS